LVWIALVLPALLLVLGLIVDIGTLYIANRAIQGTLDVSATSALDSSVIEESIIDSSTEIKIDPAAAKNNFYTLFNANVNLNSFIPAFLNGPISIQTLSVWDSGPPRMYIEARVPVKTTIMRFLGDYDIIVKSEAVEEVFR